MSGVKLDRSCTYGILARSESKECGTRMACGSNAESSSHCFFKQRPCGLTAAASSAIFRLSLWSLSVSCQYLTSSPTDAIPSIATAPPPTPEHSSTKGDFVSPVALILTFLQELFHFSRLTKLLPRILRWLLFTLLPNVFWLGSGPTDFLWRKPHCSLGSDWCVVCDQP